ncbi:hypothetical protein CANINC_003643 [Pichia inconspicua]|uniref:Genetic interactor of prohibitins 3, mitochondrial n=1 Tax=Pichia inconspicua TaxID=52247 RepID=A0A4T0WZA5_9ASCO|nr:hypothetical protein CANINC_003643 [[Candida] inconspicua]
MNINEYLKSPKYYQMPKFVPEKVKRDVHDIPEYAKKELLKDMGLERDDDLVDYHEIAHDRNIMKLEEISNYLVSCKRCHDLMDHGIFDVATYSFENVMEKIPADATVVNVMSIIDFPTACNSIVHKDRDPKSIYYFITGADYFYQKKEQVKNLGEHYLRDTLSKYMNADPDKVFFVSSKTGWYVPESFAKLPRGPVYLVGRTNAGKSSLLKRLILMHSNIKLDKKVTKTEITSGKQLAKMDIKTPGVYFAPGFTRDVQKFTNIPGLTIYDTPGYISADLGIYKHFLPEVNRQNRDYPTFTAENHRIYSSFKFKGKAGYDGNVLCSYGGVFFLQPPHGAVFQRVNFFPYKTNQIEYRCRNWERALQVNAKRTKAHVGKFLFKEDSINDMVRYVIPPFYGTIDIVIQDFGFFSIAPTSSPKDASGLFQIWVPNNVKVIIRDSIFKYLYKRHELRDQTGNVVKKSNVVRKGVVTLKRIGNDKLYFSELVPANAELENKAAFSLACPLSDIKPPIVGKTDDGRPIYPKYNNPYWRDLKV